METLLANAYTRLDQKSKLLEATELLQRKIYVEKHHFFFTKWHFEKFVNRVSGGYKMIWKLSAFIK